MRLSLLYSIAPAILIGWALRGRLIGLAQLRFRWIWLVVAGLVVQVVAMGLVGRDWSFVAAHRPAIIIATYVLILVGLGRNWRVPGMAVVAIGFGLNFLVIAANGGQMPVSRETMDASGQGWAVANLQQGQPILESKDVLLAQENTRLWQLSDVIITPPPVRRAASVGDFATYAGVWLVIVLAMRRASERTTQPQLHSSSAAA